ncbi:MAG: CHASE2 domain-containing protein [Elusimicrobiota bacterium]
MKKETWWANAIIGLLLTGYVLASYTFQFGFLEMIELKTFDLRAQLRTNLDPTADIAIVAIDDESIERLGRWPWSRTVVADLLRKLEAAGPRVVGLNVLYTEPERNPALAELDVLEQNYAAMLAQKRLVERGVSFANQFSSAAARLDADSHLLAALRENTNIVLPMFFQNFDVTGGRPPELPAAVSSFTLTARLRADGPRPVEASKASTPIVPFVEASAGLGHVNVIPDLDGTVRRETPAIRYGGGFYPSYSLALVARYLGLRNDEVKVAPGESVQLGNTTIPLDESQSMLVTYNGGAETFRYYKCYEVIEGKVPAEVFKDKMVLVGPSAAGIGTLYVTPVARSLPSIEYAANVVENILNKRFLVRPAWAFNAELAAIAVFGLFIMFGLPRLRALGGATVTALFLVGLAAAGAYLFKTRGEWVKVSYPGFLLLAGYLILQTKRLVYTERGKEFVEASQIETNKMLGLSFQGQGMLDMAFEKFRLCPLDDKMMDTLYNLGLDFERKRQYAKAVSVYQHIAAKNAKYKDIAAKTKTLQAAAEGAVFGGVGAKSAEGTVLVTGGASKPTLGRYEIIKELGRGAMGVVYLGRDPKINRQVAIKTLMLEEGATPAETKEIKERFFREAESAGTLNHPGIVRIFDAGEDQEVCYIAMELLDGHDLTRFTTKASLLPLETALDYVAKVAEALDYAHAQGIVHRDIKPANIMLLKDGAVRVTDFGIARITTSSKTATGTVMGTPSYMSPEQVAGKKVDGRSDLFSLGVALFEFVTGEKPFKGGEGIGTLLFQIANDPEPDPVVINPKLPPAVKAVIHKALMKKPEERYQHGAEIAADLRAALKGGKSAAPAPAPVPAPAPAPEPVVAAPLPGPVKAAAWPTEETKPPAPAEEEAAPKTVPISEITSPPKTSAEIMQTLTTPVKTPPGAWPTGEETKPVTPAPEIVPVIEVASLPKASAEKPPEVSLEFTPEQIAQSLSNIAGGSPEATLAAPPPASGQAVGIDESIRFVESILPQAAPASFRPEEVTSPNLAEEIARFKAEQAKREKEQPPPQPPTDPEGAIRLSDPERPT